MAMEYLDNTDPDYQTAENLEEFRYWIRQLNELTFRAYDEVGTGLAQGVADLEQGLPHSIGSTPPRTSAHVLEWVRSDPESATRWILGSMRASRVVIRDLLYAKWREPRDT